jgi:hypothetical protein
LEQISNQNNLKLEHLNIPFLYFVRPFFLSFFLWFFGYTVFKNWEMSITWTGPREGLTWGGAVFHPTLKWRLGASVFIREVLYLDLVGQYPHTPVGVLGYPVFVSLSRFFLFFSYLVVFFKTSIFYKL